MRIERFELATGRKELWKTLPPPDPARGYYIGPVLVTRDGRFWAYSVNMTTLQRALAVDRPRDAVTRSTGSIRR